MMLTSLLLMKRASLKRKAQSPPKLPSSSRNPEANKAGPPTLVRTKLYFGPKASTRGDGDGAERNDTDEEGRSMSERCFPPDITLRQFVEELNKYEPEGFRLMTDNIGNLSAYVKFESEALKRESFLSSKITLGRFVKIVKNYGLDEYRLMIDNTGNFCACLDFESASYKKHVAEAKEALRKTNTISEDVDSDDSVFDSEDESFSESDSDELSEEETPAKVGKKRSSDSEPKIPAANKKMRDGKNAGTSKQTKKKRSSTGVKRRKHGKVERNDTDQEGRSICVRNLQLDSNFGQFLVELKKFGPIKSDEFKVVKNNTGNYSVYVEYESATSKQRAIEASTISIGGARVKIKENRKAPSHSS